MHIQDFFQNFLKFFLVRLHGDCTISLIARDMSPEENPGRGRWGRCDEVAATPWATAEEAQRSALVCEYTE